MTETELLGFRLLSGERIAVLDHLWQRCVVGTQTHVLTLNPEMVMLAAVNAEIRQLLQQADVCVADGVGIEWAAGRMGRSGICRYPGVELASDLLDRLAASGQAAFLLGSAPGVAEEAGKRLTIAKPGLRIAGTQDGYFNQESESALVDRIAASGSRMLLVGMGCPRQEEFIYKYRSQLGTPLMIGVGGALEVFAGRKQRAPRWVLRSRMEWLWRSLQDLSRIRRLSVLPRFVLYVLSQARSAKVGRAE